jgi:hypothetical protein
VAENTAPTESNQAFDQVTMSPKTVGTYVDYSRKLLLQSSIGVENFVRGDLTRVIGLGIDLAGLYGTGSANQPTGVKNQSGINTKDFAAAAPTFAEIVALETLVADDNADAGTLAYLVNSTGRGGMKTTEKASSTGQFIWEQGNTVNGYRCEVSNQVAAGDFWFGNWADLVIGMWSGLDITVDPYTASQHRRRAHRRAAGRRRVRAPPGELLPRRGHALTHVLDTGAAASLIGAVSVQSETSMRIRITHQTVALKRTVRVGEVLDVGNDEGHLLLGLGKAERVEAVEVPPAAADTPAPAKPTRTRKAKQ